MTQKQEISLPLFKLEDPVTIHTCCNIYRQGGFRLEQESLNGKQIFHNYGQGNAQYSLSYGCSYLASKIMTVKQDATKIKEVAVIGSSINSLMTSLQLLKRGYKVYLYTKRLPVRKQKGQKIVEPQEGLRFWYPGGYDNVDPLKHQLISKLSFQFFKECLLSNRYQSLKWVNCYCFGPKVQQLKENVTQYINNEINQVQLGFGIEKLQQFTCYKTILINTQLFLEEIFTELRLRNIIVIQKEFQTVEDIYSLREQYIFNCLGAQNKTMFNDANVQVTKSYFYQVKKNSPSSPENVAFWIGSQIEKEDFSIAITDRKIQINSLNPISQNQHPDQSEDKIRTLTRAYHFIKQRTTKPYKL